MKRMLALGVLFLASLTLVSAKTYNIVISNTSKVGTVQLKAGEYKLKVDGGNAVFTDVNSDKTFSTPVKVETVDKKYDATQVQTTKDGDADRIDEIDLGGSKTKLGF